MTERADTELSSIYFRLYCDEDVPANVPKNLKSRGFDVLSVREVAMLGRSDEEQLAYAAAEQRVVLTHNLVDFKQLHGDSVRSGQSHSGIIVAKRRPNDEVIVQKLLHLLNTVTGEEMRGQLRYI